MPTYTYACRGCHHRFDEVQAMSDAPLVTCPKCGGKLRRVFGTVGVTFKGPGFYRTDSRKGGERSERSEKPPKSTPPSGGTTAS